MDGSRGFWNGPIVDLNLLGLTFKEDTGGDTGASRDKDALRSGEGTGANGDGDVGGDVAGVVYLDGDEPAYADSVAGREVSRGDVNDGEVGETAIVVDPVVEEFCEVFVRGGLENALEGARIFGGGGVGVADFVAIELQGLFERGIAGDRAEHE